MQRKMFAWLKSFLTRREEGATMVEYGLMIALIAVVCLGVVTALGVNINAMFTAVDAPVSAAAGS